jgi:hypothetical protein
MTAPALNAVIQGQGSVSADNLNTYIQSTTLVPNLRGFVGLPGIQVYCRGLATVNDGGGGFFYWNTPVSSPVDDGVNTIVPVGASNGCWSRLLGAGSVSTRTTLLSGAGSYLTPIGVRQLRISMVGGGGGGGWNTLNVVDGSAGATTSFNSVTAVGGQQGFANGNPGIGGNGGVGSPTGIFRVAGGGGGDGAQINNPTITAGGGGTGGNGIFGGGAASIGNGNGATNSGGGGCGAGISGGVGTSGGGGGSGEGVEFLINSPIATYAYSVGAGGAKAVGSSAGNGGSGVIIVDEFY